VIRDAGAAVFDGADYVGKIKLKDPMHFAIESTQLVVKMYSDVTINSIGSSAAGHVQEELGTRRNAEEDEARRRAEEDANSRMEKKEARRTAEVPTRSAEEAAKHTADKEEARRSAVAKAKRKADMKEVRLTARAAVEAEVEAKHRAEKEEARRRAEEEAARRAEEAEARRTAEESKRTAEEVEKRKKVEDEETQLIVNAFLSDARKNWAAKSPQLQVEPQIQIPPFQTMRPPFLPDGDDRFNKSKTQRTYACDSCGNLVSFSSWKRCKSLRAHGEFQGSYIDKSWAINVPGELMVRAYNERLIDCTWQCTQFCKAAPTGVKDRTSRTEQWRATKQSGAARSSRDRY
jgi:hypothetical protein